MSLAGLAIVATTGCAWMLFDKRRELPPCDLRMIDEPALYPPPDDIIWGWLTRYRRGDQIYVGYNGDLEKITEGLRQYQRNNRGATAIDYFTSLGMSCQAHGAGHLCVRKLTARYVCTSKQPPSEAEGTLPQYEGVQGIVVRFDETGLLGASSSIAGEGAYVSGEDGRRLWPPGRPLVR